MTQTIQAPGTRREGARMQGVRSRAITMGDLSVGPDIEYWTLDMRFKGSKAQGEGKIGFEQFMASSRELYGRVWH